MITPPHRDSPIVDAAGVSTITEMYPWITAVTELINFLDMAEGNGSPNGVLKAEKKKLYFNNSGSAGTLVYIKTTDSSSNTGWIAIG